MATAEEKPSGIETKTFVSGASGKEVNIGYSPAAVPFKDGMADGFTPGTTNTPGPYEAPEDSAAEKSTPAKSASASKTSTRTTGS